MFTVPASGPVVGQVLGMADAGAGVSATTQRATAVTAKSVHLKGVHLKGSSRAVIRPTLPTPQPTDPSMLSSISRDHSTAYSMGSVRVTGSMKPLTIMLMACCSERPRLIR